MNDTTTKPDGVAPPRVIQAERDADTPRVLRLLLDRDVDDGDIDDFTALADKVFQIADRALRIETALRLIHINVMGPVITPESGALRDWLNDWIVGFNNGAVEHGPIGGPMLWPGAMPRVCEQLIAWGFQPVNGPHDIKYVAFRSVPDEGESVN